MDVEIERAAEALDQCHYNGLCRSRGEACFVGRCLIVLLRMAPAHSVGGEVPYRH